MGGVVARSGARLLRDVVRVAPGHPRHSPVPAALSVRVEGVSEVSQPADWMNVSQALLEGQPDSDQPAQTRACCCLLARSTQCRWPGTTPKKQIMRPTKPRSYFMGALRRPWSPGPGRVAKHSARSAMNARTPPLERPHIHMRDLLFRVLSKCNVLLGAGDSYKIRCLSKTKQRS